MGLTIKEMLREDYFKDFRIIAGHGGLDNPIQGIAILDAPDGYKWTKGRELIISSGYVFEQNPGLLVEYVGSDFFKRISGLGIKLGRFIQEIPEDIVLEFNKHNIPLISIPMDCPWMDIMNQLNVLVMNKSIRQFGIRNLNLRNFSNLNYQSRKVNNILSQIEREMKFPAMLYDVFSQRPYYSSAEFIRLIEELQLEDFWNPSFDHTKELLCDNLQMIRYRFIDEKYDRPYSWITIPITVGDKIRAYFVVVEATDLIDYFDQFALRIGFLLLQSLYEQILVAQSIGDIGFEKFILDIISGELKTDEDISKRAMDLEIDTNMKYYLIILKLSSKNEINKDIPREAITSSISNTEVRVSMVGRNEFVFLISKDSRISKEENIKTIKKSCKILQDRLEGKTEGINMIYGFSDTESTIYEIKRNIERCERAIKLGTILYPEEEWIIYSDLGVFAWIDIREDELEIMTKDIKTLIENPEHRELLETLKTYLEYKMNFSLTAKHLYIHINTVRKRIEDINQIIDYDLEDPMSRLKLEILLKLFV